MRSQGIKLNPYRFPYKDFLRTPPPNLPIIEYPAPPSLGMEDPRFTIKSPSRQTLPSLSQTDVSTRKGMVVPLAARMPKRVSGFLFAYISERQ